MRRCIGLDVHREFAEVAIWEDGVVRLAGQIRTTPEAIRLLPAACASTTRSRSKRRVTRTRSPGCSSGTSVGWSFRIR